MAFRSLAYLVALLSFVAGGVAAQDADLRLAVPEEMIENGFTKHLLPRFAFKTRIRIEPVTEPGEAAMAFSTSEGSGTPVFQTSEGAAVYLLDQSTAQAETDKIAKFLDWLRSEPGRAAIEGFPSGGPPKYLVALASEEEADDVVLEGDANAGSELALVHCGRCHVVDKRNPFGGIGSTPSFPALRGRAAWSDLFLAFYAENPHPSFTQIEGVTEPFDDARPSHIAPIELTLEDVDAITAYVATLKPKNLGAQVQSR